VNAVELAELIADAIRDDLPDAIVEPARNDGPLFAVLRIRGHQAFAITIEELA
jgi:hypothetical protein